MTDTEIKHTIRRSSAIIATCLDTIFHWPPHPETGELCDRVVALLEVVMRDLDEVSGSVSKF